ncbi:uncharacterized protein LOC114459068, partial [Gouania willdenowi]|uniref:uncharacterized protein LOC114459068 n=1 Tax=Gouania willdenowi TaxID=441366 RepID=UPI001054394E
MHSRSPDFRVVCGIDGCPSEYRVYNSFYYHVKWTHAHHLLHVEAAEEEGSISRGLPGAGERTAANDQTNARPVAEAEASSIGIPASGFQEDGEGRMNVDLSKHATAFLLQARETHRLTQSAVNQMVIGVQQYQAALLEHLKQKMSNMIERHSGDPVQLKSDAMGIFDQFVDPFCQISSTHLQDKTIKELLKPVEPEIVVAKQTVCYVKHGDSRVLTIKDHCFHYIPLVKSLEQLLSHPRTIAMIDERPQTCKDGFFHDFIDGDIFKSHPLFSKFPTALQLVLYTDEIELCNPLGSRANKNKLLLIYYTLGNINPKYRSRLAAIRLLAMVKSKDISRCIDEIFQRINHDLTELCDGVQLVTANGERTIYGALMSVCGDTLAQHEVAGFKIGVGFAYSKCRHCECKFEDMQEQFNEDLFVKRTMASHNRQCNDIEKANTDFLKENLKMTYGINRR